MLYYFAINSGVGKLLLLQVTTCDLTPSVSCKSAHLTNQQMLQREYMEYRWKGPGDLPSAALAGIGC